jgi:putative endonuclease
VPATLEPSANASKSRSATRARDAASLGRAAENVAARFLISRGLKVVLRNFRRRRGEIDLVAREADVIVVVEVRTRSSQKYGGAAASINARKQARIVRATYLLLQRYPQYMRMRVRFDVVIVFDALAKSPRVQWIKHAFAACW